MHTFTYQVINAILEPRSEHSIKTFILLTQERFTMYCYQLILESMIIIIQVVVYICSQA